MKVKEWLRNNWLEAIVVSGVVWLLSVGTGLLTSVALIQKDVTNIDKTLTEMKQTLSDIRTETNTKMEGFRESHNTINTRLLGLENKVSGAR